MHFPTHFQTVWPNYDGLNRAQTHRPKKGERGFSSAGLDNGTCLVSLLACEGESEELEEAGDDRKTLEMLGAILGLEEAGHKLEDPGDVKVS